MCGVPYHAADTYITRLVRKGYRVAICEQVEDPRKAKGVVRREVVRVVSPGTLTDAAYLDAREPAFLMAIVATADVDPPHGQTYGVALIDLSTGEFDVAEYTGARWPAGAARRDRRSAAARDCRRPAATTSPRSCRSSSQRGIPVTEVEGWHFELETARQTLLDQLRVSTLEGFGLERRQAAVRAAGALLRYLRDTQKADLAHVRSIRLKKRPTAC